LLGVAFVVVLVMVAGASSALAVAPVFFGKGVVGQTVGPIRLKGTVGPSFLEGTSGTKITCATGTVVGGEITGATAVENLVLKLNGCETSGGTCENTATAREIVTNTLAGTLGNVSATSPGLRLFNQAEGRGGYLVTFTCVGGAVPVKAKGSVIGLFSGASGASPAEGKLIAKITKLTFAETKGHQKYLSFLPGEGEPGSEQLEWSAGGSFYELAGQSGAVGIESTPFLGEFGITK
jgi:hypothetical protein